MLRQKLQDDQLNALKTGNKEVLEILRFVIAKIKNQEIEKKTELTDEETVAVLKKVVRELNESKDAAVKAVRQDLIEQNEKQISIISPYLPQELSDEALEKEIQTVLDNNKELFDTNKKAIIGICMKELRSKADGTRIMKLLQPHLA
ncbi:MAG: GatB/YqeY domain-containing protein [Microgenomates group bacterium]|jgi:hypothetical protein|nr:GatB/YqeY domain-containing protein [Candidatus Woesebacteria bacterium]MBP6883063.1 GatB/YqeY domain-containing protein [Candidatus Woesebacteria bacterium]QQR63860.1 MAG: GatB/YqeY domain-containing protein [Candidatus Roizmanbacteria bacterium]